MKIIVERSGGFAGLVRRGEKDLAALLPEQLAALEKLLSEGAPSPALPEGADRYIFKIEIEDEHGVRSLTIPEAKMPACLAAIATGL
jgi:hypothetical protein